MNRLGSCDDMDFGGGSRWRIAAIIVLVATVLALGWALSGCAPLDVFFGVDPETGEARPGPSPASGVGGSIAGPAGAAAAAALGWIYSAIRGRRKAKIAEAVIAGVTKAVDEGAIPLDRKQDLYRHLSEAGAAIADRGEFEETVRRVKAMVRNGGRRTA